MCRWNAAVASSVIMQRDANWHGIMECGVRSNPLPSQPSVTGKVIVINIPSSHPADLGFMLQPVTT